MNKFYLPLIGLIFCLLTHSGSAQSIFLKADLLTNGASKAKGYTAYAEISSYQFGVSSESSWTKGGGASVGKADFKKITITKNADISSPKFMEKVAKGLSMDLIEIVSLGNIGNNTPEVVHKIELKDAFVTDVSSSAVQECSAGCTAIAESYEFVYKAIRITTYTYDSRGKATETVFVFNVAANNSTF